MSVRVRLSVGALLAGAILLTGLLAPWIAPYPQGHRDAARPLAPTGTSGHWLGTTEDGTDVLSALCHGAGVAAIVGLATVIVSVGAGTALGLVAGYTGGLVDVILMRLTEIFLAFPGFLLALLVVFAVGEPSLLAVVVALNLTGWAGFARLVRAQAMTLRDRDFVLASRALGASTPRLLFVHLLPNVLGPVLVQATFGVGNAILAEASLSYLGVGPEDATSWGALLEEGAVLFLKTPSLALLSGGALLVTIIGVNLVGDALRDRLDPRSL